MTASHDDAARKIEVEVEVPGTPEQVWEAIATGPGIAAWFAPADFEPRVGAPIAFDMGTGMEASGEVTGWDPPRRFAYEEEWQPSEDQPAGRIASEWLVEARSGGTCVVRLVASAFTSSESWDDELDQMREGWSSHLHQLRLYLTHHAGQPCSSITVNGRSTGSLEATHAAMTAALGLPQAAVGDRVAATAPDAPALAGVVERAEPAVYHRELMIRIDEPAPGTAFVYAYGWRGEAFANVHLYLYGDSAAAAAAAEEPRWRAWMDRHFAAAAETG